MLNKTEMWILLEGKLLIFLQYAGVQAAMTLKSRAVRRLNVILCSNQLSLKAPACSRSLGLRELWSCILMSPESFNFAKKLHFRFTALWRAVVNLSVVSAGWSEVKVSSSVSQGLDQMTSWGVFQPALFHDSAVRRDACSTRAAQSKSCLILVKEAWKVVKEKVLKYIGYCADVGDLPRGACLLNQRRNRVTGHRQTSCVKHQHVPMNSLYGFGSYRLSSPGPWFCEC